MRKLRLILTLALLVISLTLLAWGFWPAARERHVLPVPPAELTLDHVVPLVRGGHSNKGNCVPACKECNSKKQHLLPIEWDEYLQRLANPSR